MKHGFLDKYSDRASLLRRRDARLKIAVAAALLIAVNATRRPPWEILAGVAAAVSVLFTLSRLPLRFLLTRPAAALPFALAAGAFLPLTTPGSRLWSYDLGVWTATVTVEGLTLYILLATKTYLSLTVVFLLVATTPFPELLRALRWYRVPSLFIALLSFTYRYVFVFIDEYERIERLWHGRYFGRRRARQFLALGPIIGTLFIRSLERGDRVWAAMVSRGYDPDRL